ncbi:Hypothetical protein PAS_chr4_0106 [Komagataella phaffii GS115]|uniref:Uncharacterized protein n=1 Tax=Komagataella phaffii (strain GS115 / ATCC 20864) TaxID=644223 RepID=C4R6V7_KOMPG|nr:Hypothetical protein PAS_chr4_0106 [Komagataella phaffii GS115]CAY71332.1 Hypothetical protein PAS_chr4_0106 [Komagataella phaffii GS115]
MTVEAMNKTDLKSNSVISTVIEQDEDDSSLAPLAIDEIAEGIETIEEEASSPESSKAEEDQKQNPLKRGNSRFKHFYFKREHQKENQPVEKEKVLREPSSRLSLLRNHKNVCVKVTMVPTFLLTTPEAKGNLRRCPTKDFDYKTTTLSG